MNNPWKQLKFNVYLGGRLIDSVYYTTDCDAEYVRKTLIEHDGYSPGIVVIESK